MESDKKLETLEEELKLMKGELKQSLASVRDYLLNMELPSSEFSTILAALGDGDSQKITMKGSLDNQEEPASEEKHRTKSRRIPRSRMRNHRTEPDEQTEEDLTNPEESSETESEISPEDELTGEDENLEPEEELLPEEEAGEEDESMYPSQSCL